MLRKTLLCLFFAIALIVLSTADEVPSNNTPTLEIIINGVSNNKIKTSLLENISLYRFKDFAVSHPNQMQLLLKKSDDEIKTLLEPYGYYKPTITTAFSAKDNRWIASFNITLNEPLRIDALTVNIDGEGKDSKTAQIILQNFPLKQGDILVQSAYEHAKNSLTNSFFDQGYLDSKLITHEIRINMLKYTAEVVLSIDTGERYTIGAINIKQQRYDYATHFIQEIIKVRTGDSMSQQKISKANKRLQDSGYFSAAQFVPQISKRDETNKTVPVNLNLTADYARTYTFGVGYGTFTGPRVSFGTLFRHVTDTGQQFSFNVSASPANSTFSTSYVFPGNDPLHDNWSLLAEQSYIETDTYNERQTNFGIARTHKYGSWQTTLSLQQYLTNYDTAANSKSINGNYLVPALTLVYDGSKQNGFWRQGLLWNELLQASLRSPLSDQDFIRNNMSLYYSLPINPEWNRLLFSANWGFITVDDIQNVAPNFRFYAGGVSNLLGYPFLSQGPQVDGNVTGGRYLATGLLGIEQRIYGNFSSMLYYNMGNAANKPNFSDVEILRAGGISFSYKTPLGPFMVFFTRTLNQNDQHWRFDLNIGISL
ncbi:autotransporter assembly complex protein TamA [Caedibacter taeniospiralis]|uniref:autotransporter assembly complex protein TamA n=1 Tax=Caedibacter taeniospiralis TaxID=28907 RepID=UPI000C270CEA|nr:POTRA domain-containing protein [Caedibacter taeniospiralis]